jgi:cystathionine beta-lyase/cystathionine gamma-synthase
LAEYAFSQTTGFAMTSTERPHDNLQDIRRQLDDAKQQFDALEMKPRESLRDFEYRVKRHSDKLLSLKVAEKVQRQLLEQEARDAEEQLKKKSC